ncbi:BadF/BadG/BcrA/BcrD ATPase family protein [Reinekea thalattae]|uniref:N-acetylglucosamine kinase n=1 Tax=Reinekea thalattae TaxID=2593301 RepID=A0A5C8Z459_9GAMM|nr:BadF/BadG/BcrA/BcrD ATPase family protein [Reinekea thalattae]TXR52039.1 N-acetylglucosamine kinase [Reinekea thalattae]
MTALFLGVDGGGTFCRARLVNQNQEILGEAVGGSGNPRIGIESAWQNITNACLEACQQASINAEHYPTITLGLGLAGANQTFEQDLVLSQVSPFGQRYLLTDAHAACLGAFNGDDGGLLILGTGSCGVNYKNKVFDIIGGWGFPLSDQGSGARIGLTALEYSLAALDGIVQPSPLTDSINAEFSLSPETYVAFQNQTPLPKEFAAFAPKVFEFAQQKDTVALKIIEQQVGWVCRYLDSLVEKGTEKIVLAGGVSEAIKKYLPTKYGRYLCEPIGDAMSGAIFMAQTKIGRSTV